MTRGELLGRLGATEKRSRATLESLVSLDSRLKRERTMRRRGIITLLYLHNA